jgi:hypothetical protein
MDGRHNLQSSSRRYGSKHGRFEGSPLQFYVAIAIFIATYAAIAFSNMPRLHLDRPGAVTLLTTIAGVLLLALEHRVFSR